MHCGTLDGGVVGVLPIEVHELVAAAQQGNEVAQRTLFETHKRRVASQVLRMTGDPTCVDDLVQEVFIRAFSQLATFQGTSQLETWLYTITANKVRNYWDARRRRTLREARACLGDPEAPQTPEESLEARDRRTQFYAVLGRLPNKYREAFSARALENLSLEEASEALDVPISTVSYRTRRAEELLAQALGLDLER